MKQKYTTKDLGKFANGELGRAHCREVLAALVTNLYHNHPDWDKFEPNVQALLGPETEDLWVEEDVCLNLLGDACDEEVYFDFDNDGSLSLIPFDTTEDKLWD